MSSENNITEIAFCLAREAGIHGDVQLTRLAGGKNNRVYQLTSSRGSYLLKQYFTHPDDDRNRLKTEFDFITFAWTRGIRSVPRPIAFDATHYCALYEFIEGRNIGADEIQWTHIEQFIKFVSALNEEKELPEAKRLPKASESCFTIDEHIRCIDQRIRKLTALDNENETSRAALVFIHQRLIRQWDKTRENLVRQAQKSGLSTCQPIEKTEQYLSPSDFGFHNALLEKGGRIRFFDFEYAGWDDPAKMICDYFCQVQIPVPIQHKQKMEQKIKNLLPHSNHFLQRTQLLFPVYRIKWCCIMLNDFLTVGGQRRDFALQDDRDLLLKKQLGKAAAYFDQYCSMPASPGNNHSASDLARYHGNPIQFHAIP